MKQTLKKLAPWIGFPAFYFLCLLVFASFTFPFDKVKERIVVQFNAQQAKSPTPQVLSIDELDSSFLTGIKATGVRLTSPNPEPGKPPVELKIDEARARISLLSLLAGKRSISYALALADGTVTGSFEESSKDRAIDVTFEGVDIGRIEPVTAQLGVPIEGRLHGTLKLQLPEGKASKGSGSINLELKDVAIGDGKAKIKGLLALPKLSLGNVALVGEAKDGVLKISKLSASGRDVDLSADGRVQMRENAPDSNLDLAFKFKVGDTYRKKNEQTKMIFGEPGSKIPPLFDSVTQMKPGADGFYAFNVRGTLGSPRTSTSTVGGFGLPKSFGTGTSTGFP